MELLPPEDIQESTNPIVWRHAVHYAVSAGLNGYKVLMDIGDESKVIEHLLLTTKGRTTGKWRRTVLMFDYHEDIPFVICSNGGKPDYPDWYKNIQQDGRVWVQIERDTFWADCEIISNSNFPELKDYLIAKLDNIYPRYKDFQQMCPERELTAILLKRVN